MPKDRNDFKIGDIVEVTDAKDPDFGKRGEVADLGPPVVIGVVTFRPFEANKVKKCEDLCGSWNELRQRAKTILGAAGGNKETLTSALRREVVRASDFKVNQNVEVIDPASEYFELRGTVVDSGPPIRVELELGAGTDDFRSDQLKKLEPYL